MPTALLSYRIVPIAMPIKNFISVFVPTLVAMFYICTMMNPATAAATSSCDGPCRCEGRVVTCDNAAFTSVPNDLPADLKTLRITRSRLTTIDGIDVYKHITELTLIANDIRALSERSFQNNIHLESVNLKQNQLQMFDTSVLSGLPNLRDLDLSFNEINRIEIGSSSTGWPVGNQIRRLKLRGNKLETIESSFLNGLRHVEYIDLSANVIATIHNRTFTSSSLIEVDLSANRLKALPAHFFDNRNRIEKLNLSENELSELPYTAFSNLNALKELNLDRNKLECLNPRVFENLSGLEELRLSYNRFREIPPAVFQKNSHLQILVLSNLPNLTRIQGNSFEGLGKLRALNLSRNRKLRLLHEDLFQALTSIESLSLEFNNHSSLYYESFQPILARSVRLSIHDNPLRCNCAVRWIRDRATNTSTAFTLPLVDQIRCQSPESLRNRRVADIPPENLTCVAANVTSHTPDTFFKIGKSAVLKCSVTGRPRPLIEWRTPRGQIFRHDDYLTNAENSRVSHFDIQSHEYHEDHYWHESEFYSRNTTNDRVKILSNGNLFIDYVLRSDAGQYTCTAKNPGGNATVAIDVKLNYLVIKDITIASLIVGFSSAGVFFGLGILIGIVRFVRRKCSENERRRKSMRNILDTLDQYKSLQFDKLDKMRDNYGTQVSKIKENCIVQMDRMRENYCTQIAKIRDNCASQMDKLRENYNNQMSRIKDYSSHQIDKIRENYNNQMIKIRDYGANQLEKLRETYKLQHQHLIKILETMNMDNCRGVMETECLPNEQLFIDANFSSILDASAKRLSRDSISDSEFVTACSDSDGISLDLLTVEPEFPPETISMHDLETERDPELERTNVESHDDDDPIDSATDVRPVDEFNIDVSGSESEDETTRRCNNDSSEDSDSTPTLSVTSPQIHIVPKNINSPSADDERESIDEFDIV
ncbi:uncharacterized protein LOC141906113 [Tubulanus polymorphus]|uniref:uncharacterized protein LOC141906113 n=1 Tax=Tubulanus polymorphus TaxID=672921 RepID=UPI003DA299AD